MAFRHAELGICPGCRRNLHSEPDGDCAFVFDPRMLVWPPMGLSLKGWAIYVLIVAACFTVAERDPFGSDMIVALCALIVVASIPGVLLFLFLGRGRRYRLVLGPRGVHVLHPRKKQLFCDWASIGQVSIDSLWGHVLLKDESGGTLMRIPGAIFAAGSVASKAAETIKAIATDGGVKPVCARCGYDLRGTPGSHCTECGTEFDPVLLADWPYAH